MSNNNEPLPEENVSKVYLDDKFVSEQKGEFEKNYRTFKAERFYRRKPALISAIAAGFALAAIFGIGWWKTSSDSSRENKALSARASESEDISNRRFIELIDERRKNEALSAELEKERGGSRKKITDLEKMLSELQQSLLDARSTIVSQTETLGIRDERITELDEALGETNLMLSEYQQNLTKVQEGYESIDAEVLQLREINKSLKERTEQAEKWAELEKVFISLSDRYLGLVRAVAPGSGASISSEEIVRLKNDISASKDKFSGLQARNLEVLMASVDALHGLGAEIRSAEDRLKSEQDKAKAAEEERKKISLEYASVMLILKKYNEEIKPLVNSDGREIGKMLEDIALLKKKCEEEGSKSKAESISQIHEAVSRIYGLANMLYITKKNVEDYQARYKLLEGADQDKAKLAAQIGELNKKIEGLEGQISGLTVELKAKAKEAEKNAKAAEAKSTEAQAYSEDISFFAECLEPYTDVLKNRFLEMNAEDMDKKAAATLTSISNKRAEYRMIGDAQRAERISRLHDIFAGVASVFSAKKTIDGKHEEMKKAVERADFIFNKIFESGMFVRVQMIKGIDNYDSVLENLTKVKAEYQAAGDELGLKVLSNLSFIIARFKSLKEDFKKKAEELEQKLEETQREYNAVIFSGLARSDRDKDTGAVFVLFDAVYYKDKEKKEEGLFRVGRYITPDMAARLDAFAILAESAYPDLAPEERAKKVLSSITEHEQKNSSHFKQAWVRDDSKKEGSSEKYALVMEYDQGPPQEISVSRKGITSFVKHVVLDTYK